MQGLKCASARRPVNFFSEIERIEASGLRPGMLLHTCCAPCSTHVLEVLRRAFDLSLYFYDPNIHPKEEYEMRRDEMKSYSKRFGIPFAEGPYDIESWFVVVRGHEKDREGGERCFACYEMRMREAARFAMENRFDYFGTVLSVSPHKNAERINEIGKKLSRELGIKYLEADFKKRDGFKKSVSLSKEHGLYRQDYCGCVFSRRNG